MAEITDESIVRLYLNSELKFDAASEVCVQLTDGSAERFGCPLRLHKEYIFPTGRPKILQKNFALYFPGFHAGIFSFEGASLVIKGKLKSCFTTRNAFMVIIIVVTLPNYVLFYPVCYCLSLRI